MRTKDTRQCALCQQHGDYAPCVSFCSPEIGTNHSLLCCLPFLFCFFPLRWLILFFFLSSQDAGRLLYLGQDDWAHINCCLWSAEVYEENSALLQVHSAVSRGRHLVNYEGIFIFYFTLAVSIVIRQSHELFCPLLSALWWVRTIRSHSGLLPRHLPEQFPFHVRSSPELLVSAGQENVLLQTQGSCQCQSMCSVFSHSFHWLELKVQSQCTLTLTD